MSPEQSNQKVYSPEIPPQCLQSDHWLSADALSAVNGKAGEFTKPLCSRSTLGEGNGKFHTLRGARSDPQKDADFLIAMGNKQQRRAREVLGCCSCFQKKAVDIRESDVIFSQIIQKIG